MRGQGTVIGALAVAVVMLLAGCGGGQEDTTAGDAQNGATTGDGQAADAATLTGTLSGDPDLEGGCAWLATGDGSVEVVWPDGYEVTFDPLRLRGPGGEVVAEGGDEVTVRGEFAEDRISVCQVGQLFEAAAVVE